MKPYEIKPHLKLAALREVYSEILRSEDLASLTGESEALIWAYQETRDRIKRMILSYEEQV